MQFRAKLKQSSTVYRRWAAARRRVGKISGVPFKRVGRDYVSVDDPLPGDDVSALLRNNAVDLETTTSPVGEVAAETPTADTDSTGQTDAADSSDQADDGDAGTSEADSLAALFRNGVPKAEAGQEQEPVMRRRGRPPGPR